MRRMFPLAVLLGLLISTGCLNKQKRRAPLNTSKPIPPLPSALEKAQTPAPPEPVAAAPTNTLPDTTGYQPVAIPPAPQPITVPPTLQSSTIPTSATIPDTDPADEERKRLIERLRERKEKEDTPPGEKPMLPPAIAPKAPPELPGAPPLKPVPAKGAAVKPAPQGDLAGARTLYSRLLEKYHRLNDYECVMERREVVNGKEMPTEEILFQFRKKPFSVYMKNLGEVGKGREVLYVDGQFDGLMHVVSGQGDVARFLVGFKTALKPDSSMATSKSRHRIYEAGPGQHLAKIDKYLKMAEAGKTKVKYLGVVTRKDQPDPVEGMEITIPAGEDPLLPKGAKWTLFFEPNPQKANFGNLMVHQMLDETGREVEYYCFTKFRVPANLKDEDFHPDRLGGKKK